MIRHVAVFAGAAALLVGSVPAARSQTRPDFTGTWVVESVDSPRPQNDGLRGGGGRGGGRAGIGGGGRGMPGGRARGGAGRGSQGAGPVRGGMVAEPFQKGDRVSITQTLDTLVVVQEASGSRTSYSFDGRETSNAGASGATVKSTTRWEGVALVTESSQSMSTPRGERMPFSTVRAGGTASTGEPRCTMPSPGDSNIWRTADLTTWRPR